MFREIPCVVVVFAVVVVVVAVVVVNPNATIVSSYIQSVWKW